MNQDGRPGATPLPDLDALIRGAEEAIETSRTLIERARELIPSSPEGAPPDDGPAGADGRA